MYHVILSTIGLQKSPPIRVNFFDLGWLMGLGHKSNFLVRKFARYPDSRSYKRRTTLRLSRPSAGNAGCLLQPTLKRKSALEGRIFKFGVRGVLLPERLIMQT